MKIIISSGSYPPQVGGSAHYAYNINKVLQQKGHKTRVLSFKLERYLPAGLRHFLFFVRALFVLPGKDAVLIFDTFSSGFPTVLAARLYNKKTVLRVGGDFLWESYVERTKKEIPLSEFYKVKPKLSLKEKIINRVTRFVYNNVTKIACNTAWQKEILIDAYSLDSKIEVVENVLEERKEGEVSASKKFVCVARDITLKNMSRLKRALKKVQEKDPEITYVVGSMPFSKMLEEVKSSYAVILVSISDVSPDLIAKAIQYKKPFVVTKYTGLNQELKNLGILVDPLSEEDIQSAIESLLEKEVYNKVMEKQEKYTKTRNWSEVTSELLRLV